MILEEDIQEINNGIDILNKNQNKISEGIKIICGNQQTLYNALHGGLFLFVMVGITMIAGIRSCRMSGYIKKHLQSDLQVQNVIGNDPNEIFYGINGKRAYLEIDGKPIEEYFRE